MATRSYQSSPWAAAAGNLGEALFPSAKNQAAAKIAGQQLSELAARTRKTEAEAFGVEDQNSALAAAMLEAAGLNPREVAVIRAGRGNTQQIMEGLQTSQQMQGDQSAADAFATGDYTGVGVGRLAGGRDPLKTNEIDDGYRLNPYATGGEMEATSETLADILATNALASQRQASANYDRDRTFNPERHRAPGRGATVADISPSESKALDDLIGNYLPSITNGKDSIPAEIEPALRNAVLSRASQLYRESGNAQTAVDQAFNELVQQSQQGAPAVEGQDNWDFWGLGTPDVEAQPAKPYKFSRRGGGLQASQQAPAKPGAAARTVVRTGTHNGRRVVQYSDGTVDYAP